MRWDRVENGGEPKHFGTKNTQRIHPMSVQNNDEDDTLIRLTNHWKNFPQNYRVRDPARGEKQWLQKTIAPHETHVFTAVGQQVVIIIDWDKQLPTLAIQSST
jgi:hypothetical protein